MSLAAPDPNAPAAPAENGDAVNLADASGLLPAEALTPEQLAALAADEAARLAREAAEQEAAEREAQIQRLLQKLQKSADFPSMKESVRGIQKVSRSETAHLRALTEGVLEDVALTNKLLRLINTAFYSSVGGGSITSIKRAVALMGFQSIGMLATSLALFDKLPKGPDGDRVRAEFRQALLAAMLAAEFCPGLKQQETAYISALFQNLGRMLGWMHFRDEAEQIEADLRAANQPIDDPDALQQASRAVLHISYDDLGLEVAKLWGWPEELQVALRRLEPRDPELTATPDERLRVACTAANRLARELQKITPSPQAEEQTEACVNAFLLTHGVPLSIDLDHLPGMVERARAQWTEMAAVLGMPVHAPVKSGGPSIHRPGPAGRSATPLNQKPGANGSAAAHAPARPPMPRRAASPAVGQALSAALEAISQQAMSDAPLNEVLQLVMSRLQDALQLQRVLVCLHDPAHGELRGRIGVGDRAMQLAPLFRVPMQPPSCLFGLLCAKGADTLISDSSEPTIARRLPAWHAPQLRASTFLLLPMQVGVKPLGLIYGDRREADSLHIGDGDLTLLRAMRNQLVMAMRLRGIG
ncbi:MAG: HDOD domain-containing protein [Leptothrix sp. (in: b-proteobacteria)]